MYISLLGVEYSWLLISGSWVRVPPRRLKTTVKITKALEINTFRRFFFYNSLKFTFFPVLQVTCLVTLSGIWKQVTIMTVTHSLLCTFLHWNENYICINLAIVKPIIIIKMRKNLNLLFYLRKSKKKRNGESPVYLRITVDGIRTEKPYRQKYHCSEMGS